MRLSILENEGFMCTNVTHMVIEAYERLSNRKTNLILLEKEENHRKTLASYLSRS